MFSKKRHKPSPMRVGSSHRRRKALGRPKGSSVNSDAIQEAKKAGLSQSKVAKRLGIGIATVKRHWNIHSEKN